MYKKLNVEIKIHLHDRNGMYTVISYTDRSMELCTKHSDTFHVPLKKFKCLAGGKWNYRANQNHNDELQEFLKVVDPTSIAIDENFNLLTEDFIKLVKDCKDAPAKQQDEMSEEEYQYYYGYDDDYNGYANLTYTELENSCEYWRIKSLEHQTEKDAIIKKVGIMYLIVGINTFPLPINKGIKFVYQESEDIGDSRILLDPLQIVSNYHSMISEMFQNEKYHTRNGGWLKYNPEINTITLYGKSGDYGRYNPDLCIPLFEKLYPSIKIISLPE